MKLNFHLHKNYLIDKAAANIKKKPDKTKSFELISTLNSIRDKTKTVLEKYQFSHMILVSKIRSVSSNGVNKEKG